MVGPIEGIMKEIDEFKTSVGEFKESIDSFRYWINPINWVKELWSWLHINISTGFLDGPFLIYSIVLIWLLMFGAKWPKKWLFWGWVVFWILRGFIFI